MTSAVTTSGPSPAPVSTGRRRLGQVALMVGGLALFVAAIAGYVNRRLLDSDRFATSVVEIVRRPAVNEALARELTAQVLSARPDLVAVAPLVESISRALLASPLVTGPVRVAASQLHQAFTTPDSGQLVLRVADLGAVVVSVLAQLRAPPAAPTEAAEPVDAPEPTDAADPSPPPAAAPAAAESVALTLANIGSQGFADDTIRLARFLEVAALVASLAAVAGFALAVWAVADRRRALVRVAGAFVVVAAVLALLLLVAGLLVRFADDSTLTGAFVEAAWYVLVRPLWWTVGFLALAAGSLLLGVRLAAAPGGVRGGLVARWQAARGPLTGRAAALRALALVALGVLLLVDPRGVLTVAAMLGGAALVAIGGEALVEQGLAWRTARRARRADEAGAPGPEPRAGPARARSWSLVAGGLVVVLALLAWAAWPTSGADAADRAARQAAVAGEGEVCNGHVELCLRRFDEVAYGATHNSMSIQGAPGWFLAEQGRDIPGQLALGTRALLFDVWYGYPAGSVTRTSARSYAEALAVAEAHLGPEVLAAAQRVIASVATAQPTGPEGLYLCHGLCETGSTPLPEMLGEVRSWLATHPDEVLTLFVENHVEPGDLAAAIEAAGLGGYLLTPPTGGEPWPTLREMIRSGRRLVVMTEEGDGGAAAPWLVNGFAVTQETPYTFPTAESFSCAPNRGAVDAPLLLLNHWLAGFTTLVTSAQQVNTADVLGGRAEQCRRERDQIPNFVAVNFLDIGDTMAVVDRLNGV